MGRLEENCYSLKEVRIMALGNMNIGVDSEFIPSNLNTVLTPPHRF